MKRRELRDKIKSGGIIAGVVILILIAAYGISWIATVGIIKLITMCLCKDSGNQK